MSFQKYPKNFHQNGFGMVQSIRIRLCKKKAKTKTKYYMQIKNAAIIFDSDNSEK